MRSLRTLPSSMLLACLCFSMLPLPCAAQSVPQPFLLPVAVAYDASGDLFFADARRNQVFELTLAGAVSVVAGTGSQGFAGDGGAATSALLNSPRGLAVGADGTIYIADTGNQRIRAVTAGVIATVAGSGVRGFTGDGTALQTALRDPTGLALETDGSLVLCDTGNHRVRRLRAGAVATIAGSGIQGFAGDGQAATLAALDTPLGVAYRPDGTILIADTHNHRVRSVDTDGAITTLAGNGSKGFSGDNGQAVSASLDLPYGIAVQADGSVLIADAGNQRIRSVSPTGVMTTVAGSGVQGVSTDGTAGVLAALNNPRAVAPQAEGRPVLADSSNGLLREIASDNALYTLALLAGAHVSHTALAVGDAVYGSATATVGVSSTAGTPDGVVQVLDSGTAVASAPLVSGQVSVPLARLAAGTHVLTASYAGDGLHAASVSAASTASVTQASAIASANAASAVYGTALPILNGTVSGILPQDVSAVQFEFTSTAGAASPAGVYPILATLTGSASSNYALTMSAGSGVLTITQAPSSVALGPVAQTYAGLPLLLTASVLPGTAGTPSGSVDFLVDGGVAATGVLAGGLAGATVLNAMQGTHTLAARYRGDTNFLPSASAAAAVSVTAMPDFTIALTPASQSVQGGSAAMYSIGLSPAGGAFTGAVSLIVQGLPPGAVASISPALTVPGASGASATLSIQTVARTGRLFDSDATPLAATIGLLGWAAVLMLPVKRRGARLAMLLLPLVLLAPLGCGTRTSGTASSQGQSYELTVRGTGTNLAGAAVSHSAAGSITVF